MSDIRYAAILPKSPHIQHMFDTYEETESWMKNTHCPGYIAIIVGELRFNSEASPSELKIRKYAEKLTVQPTPERDE